jgi:hypothetical protein
MKRLMGFIFICCILAGCVDADIVAVSRHQLKEPLHVVLVDGTFKNLVGRKYAEDQLCEYINDYSPVVCLQSLNYFFPGEQYNPAQTVQTLNKLHVDAIIYFTPTESGSAVVYVPGFVSVTAYSGRTAVTGVGGGPVSKPWGNFNFQIVTRDKNEVIWYADVNAGGGGGTNYLDLIEHSAKQAAKKMMKDAMLPKK